MTTNTGPYQGQIKYPTNDIMPDCDMDLSAGTKTAPVGSLIPFPTHAAPIAWGVVDHDVADGDIAALGFNRFYYVKKAHGVLTKGMKLTVLMVSGQSYGEVSQATNASETQIVYAICAEDAAEDATLCLVFGPFLGTAGFETLVHV